MSSTSSSFASFTTHSIPIVARPHDPTLQLSIHALRSPPPASTASAEAHPHPLLLIHGHPQNSYIWHKVAPRLAESGRFDLVLVDLRGHGKSGKPAAEGVGEDGHGRYTKREMALDLVDVM